jgi:hypothetical protein
MNKNQFKAHIILRIKASIKIQGQMLDVVTEHNKVFNESGSVWVGKFGASWHKPKCDDYNNAISHGQKIYLYLVTKNESGFIGYRAKICEVILSDCKRTLIYPEYYHLLGRQPILLDTALAAKPSMWFHLSEPLRLHALEKLKLFTNKRPLIDVLKECRSTLMLVT